MPGCSRRDLFRDRLAGVLGLEHDEVAGATQDLPHQPGLAGVGQLDDDGAVGQLPTTVRSSRSQRARSGETQTRATSAVGTSPWVIQPSTPAKSFAGGAGLLSTARDYGRFLEMIRNGGALGGVRILSPRSVALMTTNQSGTLHSAPGSASATGSRRWIATAPLASPPSDPSAGEGRMDRPTALILMRGSRCC